MKYLEIFSDSFINIFLAKLISLYFCFDIFISPEKIRTVKYIANYMNLNQYFLYFVKFKMLSNIRYCLNI